MFGPSNNRPIPVKSDIPIDELYDDVHDVYYSDIADVHYTPLGYRQDHRDPQNSYATIGTAWYKNVETMMNQPIKIMENVDVYECPEEDVFS